MQTNSTVLSTLAASTPVEASVRPQPQSPGQFGALMEAEVGSATEGSLDLSALTMPFAVLDLGLPTESPGVDPETLVAEALEAMVPPIGLAGLVVIGAATLTSDAAQDMAAFPEAKENPVLQAEPTVAADPGRNTGVAGLQLSAGAALSAFVGALAGSGDQDASTTNLARIRNAIEPPGRGVDLLQDRMLSAIAMPATAPAGADLALAPPGLTVFPADPKASMPEDEAGHRLPLPGVAQANLLPDALAARLSAAAAQGVPALYQPGPGAAQMMAEATKILLGEVAPDRVEAPGLSFATGGPLPVAGGGPALVPPTTQVAQAATQLLQAVVIQGKSTTEIALSPAELGQVHLSMQADSQNPDRMVVVLSFERPETQDLFKRNADLLMSALRDAGFSGADISYGQLGSGNNGQGRGAPSDPADPPLDPDPILAGAAVVALRPLAGSTSLDLRM
jgi:hypothetical protein